MGERRQDDAEDEQRDRECEHAVRKRLESRFIHPLVVFVLEPDVPVRAVAERFVLRMAAAAERVVLGESSRVLLLALDRDVALDVVRAVLRHIDRLIAILAFIVDAVARETERARWALPDDRNDLIGRCTVSRDERVALVMEDAREMIRAVAGVAACAAVIVDRDRLA